MLTRSAAGRLVSCLHLGPQVAEATVFLTPDFPSGPGEHSNQRQACRVTKGQSVARPAFALSLKDVNMTACCCCLSCCCSGVWLLCLPTGSFRPRVARYPVCQGARCQQVFQWPGSFSGPAVLREQLPACQVCWGDHCRGEFASARAGLWRLSACHSPNLKQPLLAVCALAVFAPQGTVLPLSSGASI